MSRCSEQTFLFVWTVPAIPGLALVVWWRWVPCHTKSTDLFYSIGITAANQTFLPGQLLWILELNFLAHFRLEGLSWTLCLLPTFHQPSHYQEPAPPSSLYRVCVGVQLLLSLVYRFLIIWFQFLGTAAVTCWPSGLELPCPVGSTFL